jgi:hypothetical protein
LHFVLQHTPSAHVPLSHSLSFMHDVPFIDFFTHPELPQYASVAQSVSCAHDSVHTLVTPIVVQRNGSQAVTVVEATHAPMPSHVCAAMFVPEHTFEPHDVPADVNTAPVQLVRVTPSHVGALHTFIPAGQGTRAPWGSPETGVHVPAMFCTSHASHSLVHALLQQ